MGQTFPVALNTSQSITSVLSDASTALQTLQSTFSGTSAPTTPAPVAGQMYYDTDDGQQYWYDGAVWSRVRPRLGEDFATTNSVAPSSVIKTATIPAGFFRANGARVTFYAFLEFISGGGILDKTIALFFGDLEIRIEQEAQGVGERISVNGSIVRVSSTTATVCITWTRSRVAILEPITNVAYFVATVDFGAPMVVEFEGEGADNGDCIGRLLTLDGFA